MKHRPCGACSELVPSDTGCVHWRPMRGSARRESDHERRQRLRAAAAVADFRRLMDGRRKR